MRHTGPKVLQISDNYYDELGARLELEPEFIEHLKALDILYDRDEAGEFFQFYSETAGEDFFFEILERRGGYAGYGAANAACRIAAQKLALRTHL